MIDCSATEVAAIKNVFKNEVQVLLCHWHIKRAWETHIKPNVKFTDALVMIFMLTKILFV
jgi:hypothetical protein